MANGITRKPNSRAKICSVTLVGGYILITYEKLESKGSLNNYEILQAKLDQSTH